MKRIMLSTTIREEIKEKLRSMAEARNTTMSRMVETLVLEAAAKEKKRATNV